MDGSTFSYCIKMCRRAAAQTKQQNNMRKHLFSLLLLFSAGIMAVHAQRYDFSAINSSGDTLYYKINSDSSSVTVVSPSYNYWRSMTGYVHAYHIVIPSFATDSSDSTTYVVKAIGDSAFYYCVYLSSLEIGDSIRTIGSYAFAYTTWLSNVSLGNSVTRIGTYAFLDARLMTEVTIPQSVTYIGDGAFIISNLRTVYFNAANCTYCGRSHSEFIFGEDNIDVNPFVEGGGSRNRTLTTLIIGESVKRIPSHAFACCAALDSVVIPDSVVFLERCAFRNCTGLTSVVIGNSLSSINDNTFYGCYSLSNLIIGNSVTSIGNQAFYWNYLCPLSIPNTVTNIGSDAFSGCNGITSLVLPNSLTSIPNGAFSFCRNLRSVTIPDSVTTIGASAFQGCDSLRYVTIGRSVSQIGVNAFNRTYTGPSRIERITVLCTVPPTLQAFPTSTWRGATFDTASISGIPVYVPCGTAGAYSSANEWNRFTNLQESPDCSSPYWDFHKTTPQGSSVYYKILDDSASVAVVHPLAADTIDGTYWHGYSRTSGSLVIPDTVVHDSVAYVVRKIGSQAFKGCTGLTSVTIPATIDTIGNSAFANCYGLHTVWFNADSCRYMGEADSLVFQNDCSLYTLHIGYNVKNIPTMLSSVAQVSLPSSSLTLWSTSAHGRLPTMPTSPTSPLAKGWNISASMPFMAADDYSAWWCLRTSIPAAPQAAAQAVAVVQVGAAVPLAAADSARSPTLVAASPPACWQEIQNWTLSISPTR